MLIALFRGSSPSGTPRVHFPRETGSRSASTEYINETDLMVFIEYEVGGVSEIIIDLLGLCVSC